MSKPKRIQRKRIRGWRMPADAIYVGRPTKWGNPWSVKRVLEAGIFKSESVPGLCKRDYEEWLKGEIEARHPPGFFQIYERLKERRQVILSSLDELRGKDLACWCTLGQPCHADVLLELANK